MNTVDLRSHEESIIAHRLKEVLETVPIFAVFLDTTGTIVYANKAFATVMESTPERMVGKNYIDVFCREDQCAAAHRTFVEERRSLPKFVERDEYLVLPSGEARLIAWNQVWLEAEEDSAVLQARVGWDVTEQRRQEREVALELAKEKRIADTLQTSLLLIPSEADFPGMVVQTRYLAAWEEAQVGGDFLDIVPLADGKVALMVADASGKGLIAATRTAEVKYALRAMLREESDPSLALARLNRTMCDAVRLEERPDDGFITMGLAVVHPETGEGCAAVAAMEEPLILRQNGETEPIVVRGMPLGLLRDAEYVSRPFMLHEGDRLFLFSDGFTEARNGRTMLEYEGLVRIVKDVYELLTDSPLAFAQAVLDRTRAFAGGKLQDDACLLIAQKRDTPLPNAHTASASHPLAPPSVLTSQV